LFVISSTAEAGHVGTHTYSNSKASKDSIRLIYFSKLPVFADFLQSYGGIF
jgi:hypothetical protein